MVTRSRHLLSRRFLPFLVSPVIAGTFPFARKLARTSSLEYKGIFSKFYLQSAIYSRALGQLPCETKAVSYTGWIRHAYVSTVEGRLSTVEGTLNTVEGRLNTVEG